MKIFTDYSTTVQRSHFPQVMDFFISYTSNDHTWAEWIAWVLEEAGYSVVIQAWDFRPGVNFVLDMQKATEAKRTISVLSSLYLQKPFPKTEWATAFAQDPTSTNRKLIPVRVEDCHPSGLLAQIVYVDVFNCDEAEAQRRLLSAVRDDRMKPVQRPTFPGRSQRTVTEHIPFPGQPEPTPLPKSVPESSPASNLTPSQRRRLQQRQDTLQAELDLRSEKLKQLRSSLAIETSPAIKFQLQKQVEDEETQLTALESELETIEELLRSR